MEVHWAAAAAALSSGSPQQAHNGDVGLADALEHAQTLLADAHVSPSLRCRV